MLNPEEPINQKIGIWIGAFSVIIPAMAVCGFTPDWNMLLPYWGWMTIARGRSGAWLVHVYGKLST